MNKDYGSIFWIHLLIILIAYLSPLLFSWYIILIGAILLQAIQFAMEGCFFTIKQFGKENETLTYIGYYLQKWGIIKRNTRFTKIFIRYISKIIVVIIALVIQIIFNYKPLIL